MTRHTTQPKLVTPSGKGKPALPVANAKTQPVDWAAFLGGVSRGITVLEYGANRTIFLQGDLADSVWFLQHGEVKLAVTSQQGKEAIISLVSDNEFFGEGCLVGHPASHRPQSRSGADIICQQLPSKSTGGAPWHLGGPSHRLATAPRYKTRNAQFHCAPATVRLFPQAA